MRKGVSEIISALLMILIAASLGVTIYLFFTLQFSTEVSNLTNLYEYRNDVLATKFKVTWSYYLPSNNTLVIYIYNYGDRVVEVDSIYIDGERYVVSPPRRILVDEVERLTIVATLDSGFHDIRVVSDIGVGYEFSISI